MLLRKLSILVIVLSLTGCEFFRTRPAEEPLSQSSQFKPPFTPAQGIENFKAAVQGGIKRDYISCFVDSNYSSKSFVFVPNAEAASVYPELRAGWTIRSEEQYFANLFNRVSAGNGVTLQISSPRIEQQGDSALYRALYTLTVRPATQQLPQIFQGEMSLRLRIDSRGWWVISLWEDLKIGNYVTWSDLKGMYN